MNRSELERLVAQGESEYLELKLARPETKQVSEQLTAQVAAEVTAEVLTYCQEPRRSSEIMALLGLRHWRTFQTNYLNPLLEAGLLARTVPDKPRSSKQKYTTTELGAQWLGERLE